MDLSKQDRYQKLIALRKSCEKCMNGPGLINPATICDPPDSDQIGPWTDWQGNLDAKIMVVGQDWGDIAYYLKNHGKDTDNNPTNKNLIDLLSHIGITIPVPSKSNPNTHVIFLSNAILCLKTGPGGMGANIKDKWLHNCGVLFLKDLINIISPQILISLGKSAYHSICTVYNLPMKPRMADAVDIVDGYVIYGVIRYFPMFHCSQRVVNSWRSLNSQHKDWGKIVPIE